jgi:hypothetical protein
MPTIYIYRPIEDIKRDSWTKNIRNKIVRVSNQFFNFKFSFFSAEKDQVAMLENIFYSSLILPEIS